MTERERLIELLNAKISHLVLTDTDFVWTCERINNLADHLLDNGVIVPPCEVGDKVYVLLDVSHKLGTLVIEDTITKIGIIRKGILYENGHDFDEIGKTVFFTREEAEKAIAERLSNGKDT